ncbi:MAG: hypothetical protein ACYCOU_12775, partial [Sulfobacillus sp.]
MGSTSRDVNFGAFLGSSEEHPEHLSCRFPAILDGGIRRDFLPDLRSPFFVFDAARLQSRVDLWAEHLPEVKPFYAVKCNPEPMILRSLMRNAGRIATGIGYDCA